MHLLLTDRLSCPRCGPEFGLILLADRIEERRVYEGLLGCPNCRDRFPVVDGFGDLRAPPRTDLDPGPEQPLPEPDRDETVKLAALLGVTEGPGHLALLGSLAPHAPLLAAMIEEIEVVAVGPELVDATETPGVSRIAARPGLPFFSRALRGVALTAADGADRLDEAARVVASMARVVVVDVDEPDPLRERLEAAGLEVVLDEQGVLVASR